MPHKHAFPEGRLPGIYCSGHLPNGEPCQKMLAADTAGLYVLRRDQMVVVVERVVSIRCPVCFTDNTVVPTSPQPALVVAYVSPPVAPTQSP